jgi:hypothetical protein
LLNSDSDSDDDAEAFEEALDDVSVEGTRQLAESWKRRYSQAASASEVSDEEESSEWSCERDDAEDEDGSSTATEGDVVARQLLLRQNERLLERAKRRRQHEDSEVGVADMGQGGLFFEATAVSVCETTYFAPPMSGEEAGTSKGGAKGAQIDSEDEFELAQLDDGEIQELDEFLSALDSPNVDAQMTLKPSELFHEPKPKPKKNKYLSKDFLGERAVSAITRGVQKTAISPPTPKNKDNCCIM